MHWDLLVLPLASSLKYKEKYMNFRETRKLRTAKDFWKEKESTNPSINIRISLPPNIFDMIFPMTNSPWYLDLGVERRWKGE
jgi:hypothetical protein